MLNNSTLEQPTQRWFKRRPRRGNRGFGDKLKRCTKAAATSAPFSVLVLGYEQQMLCSAHWNLIKEQGEGKKGNKEKAINTVKRNCLYLFRWLDFFVSLHMVCTKHRRSTLSSGKMRVKNKEQHLNVHTLRPPPCFCYNSKSLLTFVRLLAEHRTSYSFTSFCRWRLFKNL